MVKYVQSGYIFAQSVANGVGCYLADEALGDVCPVFFYLTDIARLYG